MWNTTLCYIEREGQYLMLHRVKKENDVNQDKWVGIGGKFEGKESPEECLRVFDAYRAGNAVASEGFTRGLYYRDVE